MPPQKYQTLKSISAKESFIVVLCNSASKPLSHCALATTANALGNTRISLKCVLIEISSFLFIKNHLARKDWSEY